MKMINHPDHSPLYTCVLDDATLLPTLLRQNLMKYRRQILILIASIILIGLAGCGKRDGAETLVVALKPDRNPDAMLDDQVALREYLESKLGRRVEVRIPMSGAVIQQGMANGTIDLAWLSSTDAYRYGKSGDAEILLAGEIDGDPFYQSVWLVRKEATFESIEDLRGRPVAFASPTSTSGFLIPVWDLYQRGLIDAQGGPRGFFGRDNVFYGTGYVSAVQRVFDGVADAAAVSDYVFLRDKHLSAGERDRLRILQTQGPVPTHTLSVRKGLDPTLRSALLTALLEMNDEAPGLRDRVFTSRLIEVDPDTHIRVTRDALDFSENLRP